jgi:prophage regulatory protein
MGPMPSLDGVTVPKDNTYHSLNILSKPDVCRKVKLSSSSLWRYVKNGMFPPPIDLGPNRVGWIESEVDSWIEGKAQSRGNL